MGIIEADYRSTNAHIGLWIKNTHAKYLVHGS